MQISRILAWSLSIFATVPVVSARQLTSARANTALELIRTQVNGFATKLVDTTPGLPPSFNVSIDYEYISVSICDKSLADF